MIARESEVRPTSRSKFSIFGLWRKFFRIADVMVSAVNGVPPPRPLPPPPTGGGYGFEE